MKIIEIKKSDVKELFNLEKEVFGNDPMALSLSSFYYHISKNRIFAVKVNSELVAYILWLEREKYFRLYSLAVSPRFQGKGLGSKLLKYSFDKLEKKSMQLEVRASNEKAINLYEKFEFKKIKDLKDFYDDEDGVLMRMER